MLYIPSCQARSIQVELQKKAGHVRFFCTACGAQWVCLARTKLARGFGDLGEMAERRPTATSGPWILDNASLFVIVLLAVHVLALVRTLFFDPWNPYSLSLDQGVKPCCLFFRSFGCINWLPRSNHRGGRSIRIISVSSRITSVSVLDLFQKYTEKNVFVIMGRGSDPGRVPIH